MADWYIPPLAKVFPSVRWYTRSDDVWLTFDDGPHADATPSVLEVLRQEGVRATFFVLGSRAERYPELIRSIRDAGHVIGSHGYDHQPVWSMERHELTGHLRRANEAIVAADAHRPSLYRPTYGRFRGRTVRVARDLGLETVLFGVNSWDFAAGELPKIVDRTVRRTRSGDILLFHDNDATAPFVATAVREVVTRLRAAGITFGIPGPS